MTTPHKMDFHQRAVPSPMERMGKRSPRRMITMRASALSQISASLRIAEAKVISGTKNTNTWRIATIAKSEINSPAHVARETFAENDACSGVSANAPPMLSVCMGFVIEMLQGPIWIQENAKRFHATMFADCHRSRWQAMRLPYSMFG